MKSNERKAKVWKSVLDVTDEEINHVLSYVRGDMKFVDLMRATRSSTMSCYSLIARTIRVAYKQGFIKVSKSA